MENRRASQATEILDFALEQWNLSLSEEEVLYNILILIADKNINVLKQVQFLLEGDTKSLLPFLDEKEMIEYADERLDLINGQDEDSLVDALDNLHFSWSDKVDIEEHIRIVEDSGFTLSESTSSDIVTDLQMEEMLNIFLNADFNKRDEILKLLI